MTLMTIVTISPNLSVSLLTPSPFPAFVNTTLFYSPYLCLIKPSIRKELKFDLSDTFFTFAVPLDVNWSGVCSGQIERQIVLL